MNDSHPSLRGERGRLKRVLFVLDLNPRKFGGLEELTLMRARAFRDRGGLFLPVRDGTGGVRAAMNVTVHAAETSVDTLLDQHLPRLLRAAESLELDLQFTNFRD